MSEWVSGWVSAWFYFCHWFVRSIRIELYSNIFHLTFHVKLANDPSCFVLVLDIVTGYGSLSQDLRCGHLHLLRWHVECSLHARSAADARWVRGFIYVRMYMLCIKYVCVLSVLYLQYILRSPLEPTKITFKIKSGCSTINNMEYIMQNDFCPWHSSMDIFSMMDILCFFHSMIFIVQFMWILFGVDFAAGTVTAS